MRLICTAMVEDERQRANLVECVKVLGCKPQISNDTICVEYEGSALPADKLIELFAQYPFHGISTIC